MELQRVVSLLLVLISINGFVSMSQAYQFHIGGKHGWVSHPSEDFNDWAERNRFQVNDTLLFKYKKGSDSVLVVSEDDYYSCNTKKPMLSLTDGHSVFKISHSGPFFFISGNAKNCNKGQRLYVVVLAVRHKTPWNSPPPMAAPPMAAPPPQPKNQAPTMPPVAPTPKSWNPSAEAPKAEATVTSHLEAPAPAPEGNGSGAVSAGWVLSIACVVGVMSVVFW